MKKIVYAWDDQNRYISTIYLDISDMSPMESGI